MLARAALAVMFSAAMCLVAAVPAWAHAFQVQHTPAQGARLAFPPREVALQFSEPVVRSSVEVVLRDAAQRRVRVGEVLLEPEGRVSRVPLPPLEDGVYVASWQVESAVDGHATAGEFAFAVGDAEGAVPSPWQAAPLTPGSVIASWLVLVGLSLGGGALLTERVLATGDAQRGLLVLLARVGLLSAAGGALGRLTSLVPDAQSGPAVLTRPWLLSTGVAGALAVALALTGLPQRRWWSLALTVGAAALWSGQAHAAAFRGAFGTVMDFAHLVTAGGWVGSLAAVVALLWQSRDTTRAELLRVVAGYARLALWLAVAAVLTGTLSAVGLLDGLRSLWDSGYGLALLVKIALVIAAIGAALLARLRGLPGGRLGLLRSGMSVETGVLGVVLVVTAVLTNLGPPVGARAVEALLGPPPMPGPVARAAGLAGSLNVEVLAGADRLQAQVFSPSGPVAGTDLTVEAEMPGARVVTLRPRPCGTGCVTQELALPQGLTQLIIDAGAPGWTGGRFNGRLAWPPNPTQPELLHDLVDRMRAVPQLEMTERVSSGPGAHSGPSTVVLSGRQFVELAPYASGEAVDVRRVWGDPSSIELALPAARIWVTIQLDDQGRIAGEHIVSPGHEIDRRFAY